MARLKIATSELQETVGSFVLDAITPMVGFIVDNVVPAVGSFIENIGGKEGLGSAFSSFIGLIKNLFLPVIKALQSAFDDIKQVVVDNQDSFQALFNFLKNYVAPFLGGVLKIAVEALAFALSNVLEIVAGIVSGFRAIISLGSKVADFVGGAFGGGKATGGTVAGGTTYLVGEQGPELFTPSASGYIVPNNKLASGGGGGNTINITVNGAVDPISTARQIANLLNREATLSGNFNKVGSSLLVGA
jgi:hypothetical protein